MKQVIQDFKTGELKVEEVLPPALKQGGVLVRNVFSLISAGTERSTVSVGQSSLLGKARKRPDLVKQVLDNVKREGVLSTYQKVQNRLDTPKALGYSSAGVVIEVAQGIDEFQVGGRVACAGGGYACHAEVVFVPRNLCVSVPKSVDFDEAAFTTAGAVAMQGVRQANITVGDNVAVIGLGLIGLITVQILKASGCNVLGIDIDPHCANMAKGLGADSVAVRGVDDVARAAKALSGDYGVDAVIITAATKSNDPIELAGEILRDRGRAVIVGAVKVDIPRKPFYEKELEVTLSRSYGPGRYDSTYEEKGIDYPIGYVRWTEKRNMESFLKLVSDKKVNLKKIITHKFKIEDASKAYGMITGKTKSVDYLGVLIDYGEPTRGPAKNVITVNRRTGTKPLSKIGVGFVGAGNFAQSSLLPHFKHLKDVDLKGVATATGINAQNVAKKFGFEFCTTDSHEIIANPEIDCVFIVTRHNLHAELIIEAITHRKSVFVEKPLALSEVELGKVIQAYCAHPVGLMVGFNRRFASLTRQVKDFFKDRKGPMVINYRVNAGFIPKTHWIQDPEEGGGRIVGEVCHFVDLIQYLTDSEPLKVYTESLGGKDADSVIITISLRDGSVGAISYLTNGDVSLPKERIEVFADNSVAVVDDFKSASLFRNGRQRKIRKIGKSKGHKEEILAFINCLKNGEPSPIDFESIALTTLTTFRILDSKRRGVPVEVGYC